MGTSWKEGAENQLGLQMDSTPLVSDGKVRLRGGRVFPGAPGGCQVGALIPKK